MSDSKQMTSSVTFNQFGKAFQERVLTSMIVDKHFAENILEVFNTNYFDLAYLRFLSEKYLGYAKKYKTFPSLQILLMIVRDELKTGTDVALREQVVEYIKRVHANTDACDLPFVKEKALEFCRRQALRSAFEKALDNIEQEKYDDIVKDIREAIGVGQVPSLGLELLEDFDARFTEKSRDVISTGLDALDKKFNGGLGRGELSVLVAPSGAGKSHFLVQMAANGLRQKKNVVYYTFELYEPQVSCRIDTNICDIDYNDLSPMQSTLEAKQKALEMQKNVQKMYGDMDIGRLFVKFFPTKTATVNTLRNHLERLELKKGFVPDMVILDYADIMKPSQKYNEKRDELQSLYQELRAFAYEKNVALHSACQSNRGGANKNVVDSDDIADAYSKVAESDIVMTLSRKSVEKASGAARLFLTKSRVGTDGWLWNMHMNTARSQFKIIGEAQTLEETTNADEFDTKKLMKEKWNSLNSELKN
jgi:replicative DNA helicase